MKNPFWSVILFLIQFFRKCTKIIFFINIFRIDDPRLAKNEFENDIELSPNEVLFWNDLLKKYLHPIDANKQREVIIFFYFLVVIL